MLRSCAIAVGLVAALSPCLAAQAPAGGAPQIKGQTPILGRPTLESDPAPIFDFDYYFIGKWAFEIDVPDTDLGPGGTIKGTTTYTAVPNGAFDGGRFYEAETNAVGPGGPFKTRELIAYQIAHKSMSRQVTDSRGFNYLQIGPIGADNGGYFNLLFYGSPFTYKGKSFRLEHTLRLMSPIQYKQSMTLISSDGTSMPYGTSWWKKEVARKGATAK